MPPCDAQESDAALIRRIRGEYLEMPGLRLSQAQAMRMWSVDGTTCVRLLQTLVATGFLQRDATEGFVRVHAPY